MSRYQDPPKRPRATGSFVSPCKARPSRDTAGPTCARSGKARNNAGSHLSLEPRQWRAEAVVQAPWARRFGRPDNAADSASIAEVIRHGLLS